MKQLISTGACLENQLPKWSCWHRRYVKASKVCRGFLPPEGAAGAAASREAGEGRRRRDAGEVPLDSDGNSFSSLWRVLEKRGTLRRGKM